MKYVIACIVLGMMTMVARSQNEDKPICVIPQDSIVKYKISKLAGEDKTYQWGLVRKKYSYNIIYTFDSAGNIISQEWISLKSGVQDHINTYLYDEHGNLIERKIDGAHLHVKYNYYFIYDSSGRINQYYTEPRKKLLFRYKYGKLQTKMKVTPTDTSDIWNYDYQNDLLKQETYYTKGLPSPFIIQYFYKDEMLMREVHRNKSDTAYTVVYTYDASGNKISETQTHRMEGNSKTWEYNHVGHLVFYQNKMGKDVESVVYVYNAAGLLIEIKRKNSSEFGSSEISKLYYTFKP